MCPFVYTYELVRKQNYGIFIIKYKLIIYYPKTSMFKFLEEQLQDLKSIINNN